MKPVGFDWYDEKAAANLAKHGVSFEEAMTVFNDPLARFRDDPDHSAGEQRQIIAGLSDAGRLLLVFTEREEIIRLVTARPATNRERKHHEETRET